MFKFRKIQDIEKEFHGKQIEIVRKQNNTVRVRLLEAAGQYPAGTELTAQLEYIEEIDESGTTRYFDENFAEILDTILNMPYESVNNPCNNDACENDDGFQYTNTGYVINDTHGLFVEKKCNVCSALTHDGDGDFFSYFVIEKNGDVVRIEDGAIS